MTYEPLHHKYRPQTFADLVGQDAIATTLSNAIELERIAPAYLFSGPRGTGKTSSARILAKSLNCLSSDRPTAAPCGICEACQMIARGTSLDVTEIDAASNTGVDNIRELIERSQFAPVQCRFKIYCLDEVHMLSTAAFNALLKTLEEPPNRVVFVLATTDPQRVLPTIISRCQRFDFRRIPLSAMVDHLTYIAQQESIAITPDAIELIAQLAQGGLRDAESLLDQLSLLAGQITLDHVWDLAGSVPEQDLLHLLEAIATRHPETLLEQVRRLLDRGREPLIVLQNLTSFYRDLLIAKTAPARRDLVAITEQTWADLCAFGQQLSMDEILRGQQHLRQCEVQVKNTTQPRLWLEISILGLMAPVSPTASDPPLPKVSVPPHPPQDQGRAHPQVAAPAPAPSAGANPPPQAVAGAMHRSPSAAPVSPAPDPAAPVSAAPVSAAPVSPAPEPAPPTIDLAQTWQALQRHLSPLTSALLVEHGTLLSLRGSSATLGITTKPLAKIALSRLADIEAAFAQLMQRPIKVTLEVLKPADPAPAPLSAPTTDRPPAPPPVPPTSPFDSPAVAPAPLPTAPERSPQRSRSPSDPLDPPVAEGVWEPEDDLTAAARSFAQFFNGALVELSETDPRASDQEDSRESSPPLG
ncbi:DNA polymerase III subunit gamma/tau [Lyngbya confervoides]|uniref:DNA polymerase III subunit gamma/tau n=1 Tax=Lyngbya confervoides BDU141951 TaxID=1574623 RepID=A0ABD4T376_9CYAN|nr:DNA polymerase III subunit gamma/tau [Lyngbya confervoides]MCM1983071.1 DNA polymerase III subunit gamma/tau [Lyngbya confervoides BDU141951]